MVRVRDFVCPIEELASAIASSSVFPRSNEPLEEEEDCGLEYIDEPEVKPVLSENGHDAPMTLASDMDSAARQMLANPPIPRTLPSEIDILTSSGNLALPIILISSKEVFNQTFSIPHCAATTQLAPPRTAIGLGDEHAYVFWGFFKFRENEEASFRRRVVGMWDVEGLGEEEVAKKVGGRVEWVFELEWVPGWDGNEGANAARPWWADVLGPERAAGAGADSGQKNLRRRLNLNLIPTQLVDGQEEGSADEAMPRGWLCRKCGRLNQKAMMRHRWCGGVALGCRVSMGVCFWVAETDMGLEG